MSGWNWPDWVPEETQKQIEQFWSPDSGGRTPEDWRRNAIEQGMPELGQRVRMWAGAGEEIVEGRFVHAWNNIGRIVMDDGTVRCVCNPHPLLTLGDTPQNWYTA